MKKIIIAAVIASVALVGCTSQSTPNATVTVTEQAPMPAPENETVSGTEAFIDFVQSNGGMYGSVADEPSLISLGNTICDGFRNGLSEDEITYILAESLVNSNMGNEEGAKFGAALMVGAKNYLCGSIY